ncbi:MAG TPA: LLM class flavin-dependent oxidoreductase, partial [Nitrososphaerales archaeon]|nr:LLM class flavin-dependent oxidoreductase [Nitrososphaerales archaeon]
MCRKPEYMLERFGVTFDWRGATMGAISNISKLADVSGFGYLWIPEAWGLEAFSTIGYLFGVTKNIKIGAGIVNVYSRSAATIAMASATLDQI